MSEARDTTTGTLSSQASTMSLVGGPEDVVRHPAMTISEKRQILARWASDTHAVENSPALRQLDDGSVVMVDEILAALKALDGREACAAPRGAAWRAYDRRRGRLPSRVRGWRRPRDEDDDPPPRPAAAAVPVTIAVAA